MEGKYDFCFTFFLIAVWLTLFSFLLQQAKDECQIVSVWPSFASLQTLELLSIMMTRLVFTLRQGGEGE